MWTNLPVRSSGSRVLDLAQHSCQDLQLPASGCAKALIPATDHESVLSRAGDGPHALAKRPLVLVHFRFGFPLPCMTLLASYSLLDVAE